MILGDCEIMSEHTHIDRENREDEQIHDTQTGPSLWVMNQLITNITPTHQKQKSNQKLKSIYFLV